MVVPPRRLRLQKESSNAFRKAKLTKTGVSGGKGAPERSGGTFIGAQRKPLRRRAAKPPQRAARSDSALERPCECLGAGLHEAIRAAEAARITTGDSGG